MIVPVGIVAAGAILFFVKKGGKKRESTFEDDEDDTKPVITAVPKTEPKKTEQAPPKFKEEIVLEMQRPWSRKLVGGEKTMEIRAYNLPKEYSGKWIEILESPRSSIVSTVPDKVIAGDDDCEDLYLVGRVMISDCKEYKSMDEFAKDEALHFASDSNFGFKEGKPCFGWKVKQAERYDCPKPCPSMQRVMRSLFKTVEDVPVDDDGW